MMTVAQVIEELQKLPGHAPVMVTCEWMVWTGDEAGGPEQSAVADLSAVVWEGNHVLLDVAP